jgi:drug/metabolite transporter (DMT)-like permease
MLFRVQTFWLLLASASGLLTLNLSFYSGVKSSDNLFHILNGKENMVILVLTVLTAVAGLVTIFLFRNRKRQFRVTLLCLFSSLVILALYFVEIGNYSQGTYNLWMIFSVAVPVFYILAARGIRKDEKLVKSLDRLR